MLHINDITYRIEGRLLLDQATAAISDGWKTGFIGRNGAGKSTLLRLIKGDISPDAGEISLQKNRRLGGVDQEAPASRQSLIDTVLAADIERSALLRRADEEQDPHRLAEIYTRLADIDAHSAEARAATILSGLGFDSAAQKRACAEFSGGWRMRVALAAALFAAPDLLLLDEPTNYLDLEGAVWLETYLRRYPYSALIVSHDRAFLNRCATHILALQDRKLTIQPGDYDAFERRRAEARAQAFAFKARQEAKRRHMQSFVDRFRAKASKAKQAQSRLKALERLQETALPTEERAPPFHFRNPRPMAPPIVRLVDATLGYASDQPVLRNVNLRFDQDDRIAILGPNGEGKSTLVKAISGRLPPLSGAVYKHKKLQIAYFSQHQIDELRPAASPYDHVRALLPDATEAETRSATAQLGFGPEKADTVVEKLSGGEKARLLLGLITFNGPHLIVLDEPTNHLDIEAREALTMALNEYKGAVILITHDAQLAAGVADRLWLVKDGAAKPYDGDLDDYRALIIEASKSRSSHERASAHSPKSRGGADQRLQARKSAADAREAVNPLKKKVEAGEKRVEELNGVLARLDAALSEPGLFEKNIARAQKLSRERGALIAAIAAAEEEWLKALEAYENATA